MDRTQIKEYVSECASKGDFDGIEEFIMSGEASIESKNQKGFSLLALAALGNHQDCCEKLITILNANLNTRNKAGWTPLMIAAFKNQPKIIKVLMKHGADPFLKNKEQRQAKELAKTQEIKTIL